MSTITMGPWPQSTSYHTLDTTDTHRPPVLILRLSRSSLFMIFLTSMAVLVTVFSAGMHHARASVDPTPAIPIEKNSKVFIYNETFSERPSTVSDVAWESMFPLQGGFFRRPTIATQRSALAVFHQLHCLNGIQEGYWIVHDAAIEGKRLREEDLPMMSSTMHIRHCIELLRQSLMCNPDLTIEVKDQEKGGVTGFGTEHQCSNWDQILEWMAMWENYEP